MSLETEQDPKAGVVEVDMPPKALQEGSNKKRILYGVLKTVLFMVCLAGFTYQTYEVLAIYFRYPSVIDIQVRKGGEFIEPAITICNGNKIKRSKYCAHYPDRCQQPPDMEAFCEKNPYYCVEGTTQNFTIPVLERIPFMPYGLADIHEDGHSYSDLFIEGGLEFETDYEEDFRTFDGPYYHFINRHTDSADMFPCYTKNARYHTTEKPLMGDFEEFISTLVGQKITLDVEPSENFDPRFQPGAYLSIHSPFILPDPHSSSTFMKPGHEYLFSVKLGEDHSLPYPYQTDCRDYDREWRTYGEEARGTARSRKVCQQDCIIRTDMKCYKCISQPSLHLFHGNECAELAAYGEGCDDPQEESEIQQECMDGCKRECVLLKYQYTVEERPRMKQENESEEERLIDITISMEGDEVQIVSHKPQFLGVEMFIYIGGLVGIWLGVSIWTFTEHAEKLLKTISAVCQKRKPLSGASFGESNLATDENLIKQKQQLAPCLGDSNVKEDPAQSP